MQLIIQSSTIKAVKARSCQIYYPIPEMLKRSCPNDLRRNAAPQGCWKQSAVIQTQQNPVFSAYSFTAASHAHKPEDTAVSRACTQTHNTGPLIISNPVLLLGPHSSLMCLWPKVDFAVSLFTSLWCRGCMLERLNQKGQRAGGGVVRLSPAGLCVHAHVHSLPSKLQHQNQTKTVHWIKKKNPVHLQRK